MTKCHFALLFLIAILLSASGKAADEISFNTHVRPILADRCFACHGPDSASRKAGLRLDLEASAKAALKGDGDTPIVPGKPHASSIIDRMTSTDQDEVMPPPESKLTMTENEIAVIKEWIKQGAPWQKHWAFISPVSAKAPIIDKQRRDGNEIDDFIGARLAKQGLSPSPAADKERLLRRLSFDLSGLPPTIAELDAFLADDSGQSYERAVDRLLAQPSFGERMALEWLDVARYGDTDGLFEDHPRKVYAWRDWVIGAFNDNLPYDSFITWQIAGDLLPKATRDQKIATGFLRHNPTSNEGGIIQEDYRVKYLVDRVNTTATAFLGLTMECAQCHDHKYDPMTQREYYQFAGFFNNLVGNGKAKGAVAPTLKFFSPEHRQRLKTITAKIDTYDKQIATDSEDLTLAYRAWRQELDGIVWGPVTPASVTTNGTGKLSLVDARIHRAAPAIESDDNYVSSPVSGRFVRVELPDDVTQFLTVSELQVFSRGRNIARRAKATQSSNFPNSFAAKAIDGDHSGKFAGCACTTRENAPWIELDLGSVQPIDSVVMWNRSDCCSERLNRAIITVLDSKRQAVDRKQFETPTLMNPWILNEQAPPTITKAETATDTIIIDKLQAPILALRLTALVDDRLQVVPDFVLSKVSAEITRRGKKKPEQVSFTIVRGSSESRGFPSQDAIKGKDLRKNGWSPGTGRQRPQHLTLFPQAPIVLEEGETLQLVVEQRHNGQQPLLTDYVVSTSSDPRVPTLSALPQNAYAAVHHATPDAKRDSMVLNHYRSIYPPYRDAWTSRDALRQEKAAIEKDAIVTMIAADDPKPRKNYLLERGEYDKRGEEVPTAAPASIMPYGEDYPANRLGLAQWLTDPANPLTARVAVNRYWQMIFGTGLVKTSEDFGTQGDRPSHQALLDHLAVSFVDSGWDVKALIKKMVTSATYRQASARDPEVAAIDPENRLLSRSSRSRLQAEFIRDHALASSGALIRTIGGPGVNPYQPAELFGRNAIGAARTSFTQSDADGLYRRSLYTYWKRQIPAANMRILGADGRTVCRTRREQTNTPLQALVMLNDPQFVEAARIMAERVMRAESTPESRLELAFRLATSRRAKPREIRILMSELQDRLAEFNANPEVARSYLTVGVHPLPKDLSHAELAAYSAVASLILNLDESLSKS